MKLKLFKNQDLVSKYIKLFGRFFIRRIYWFLIPLLLLIYIFYSKAMKIEGVYKAYTTFMLADEDLQSQQGAFNLAAQLGLTNMQVSSNKTLLKELLDSRKLVENTFFYEVKFHDTTDLLINHYIRLRSRLWGTKPDVFFKPDYKVGLDDNMDSYLASLAFEIKASYYSEIKESGFFSVSYSSPDQYFTKLFLETHLQSLSDYYKERRIERAKNILFYAQRRTDSLSSVLSGKESAVAASIDNNMLGVLSVTKVAENRNKRNAEIVSTLYSQAVINLESAKMGVVKETPMIQIVDDIRLPLQFIERPLTSNLILGSIMGVVIGLVVSIIAFAIKYKDQIITDFFPKLIAD